MISSVSTTDFVVLVTEPTPSGLHDLERAADLCAHFERAAGTVVNKAGLDHTREDEIEAFCARRDLPVLGRIPYDTAIVDALMAGRTIAEMGGQPAAAIRAVWGRVVAAATGAERETIPS